MKSSSQDITVLFSLSNNIHYWEFFRENAPDDYTKFGKFKIYGCEKKEVLTSLGVIAEFFDQPYTLANNLSSYLLIDKNDIDKLGLIGNEIVEKKTICIVNTLNETNKLTAVIASEIMQSLIDESGLLSIFLWSKLYFIDFISSITTEPHIKAKLQQMKDFTGKMEFDSHCELLVGDGPKVDNIYYYANQVESNFIILSGKNFVTNLNIYNN